MNPILRDDCCRVDYHSGWGERGARADRRQREGGAAMCQQLYADW